MRGVYRCPVCGSTRMVWDERSGYVVCSSCGAVVDEIIYDGPARSDADHYWIPGGELHGVESGPPSPPRRSIRAMLASPEPVGLRVDVAVSVYRAAVRAGIPSRRALKLARKATGLPVRTIRSALAKYKA
ncbi:TFIIB-type zinc ribbon-containing protein [Stetteria hydrogenophila]